MLDERFSRRSFETSADVQGSCAPSGTPCSTTTTTRRAGAWASLALQRSVLACAYASSLNERSSEYGPGPRTTKKRKRKQ